MLEYSNSKYAPDITRELLGLHQDALRMPSRKDIPQIKDPSMVAQTSRDYYQQFLTVDVNSITDETIQNQRSLVSTYSLP
jgi:hypothetical protein